MLSISDQITQHLSGEMSMPNTSLLEIYLDLVI